MTNTEQFKSLPDYLKYRDKDRDPNGPVIDYFGNIITRKQSWEINDYYKNFMYSNGVEPGSVVGICNRNSAEYQFFYESILELGGVVSTVSLSFFKNDFKRQILEKNAETLILSVEFITPEVKEVLTILKEGNHSLKRIIFTSEGTYRPKQQEEEYNNNLFGKEKIAYLDLPKNIEIIYPNTIKDNFEKGIIFSKFKNGFNLLDNDATYSNSGGTTTGIPKCAVHKHRNIIEFMRSHEPDVFPEADMRVGDRTLLLIPFSHITAQYYSYLLSRAAGATLVYNPTAFDPNEIARTLVEQEINSVLSPFGLYIPLLHSPLITKNSLKNLRLALCGGEPTPEGPTRLVNGKLVEAGSNPLVIGCGSTEFGSGIMGSYGIPNRNNESGVDFVGVKSKIINPYTGKEVRPGERGIYYCNAPWQMDRYLNNEKATKEFFHFTDDDGTVYGTNNDIVRQVGEHKGKPVYQMEGRASDFVLKNSETQKHYAGITFTDGQVDPIDFSKGNFKFDMRDKLLNIMGILEAEVTLVPSNKETDEGTLVVNLTTFPNADLPALLRASKEMFKDTDFKPSGIIFRTNFARSLSTDKRETHSLVDERNGYYIVAEDDKIYSVELPENEDIIYTLVDDETKISKVIPPAPRKILTKDS